jgi:hypothetical protein
MEAKSDCVIKSVMRKRATKRKPFGVGDLAEGGRDWSSDQKWEQAQLGGNVPGQGAASAKTLRWGDLLSQPYGSYLDTLRALPGR